MWERASGTYVGGSGLHRIDWSVPNVEIGYWIRTRFEGRGFVTEAAALLAAFAFDTLQAQRVRIRCDAANARSAAVPRRLGFVHEATLRNEARHERRELARHVRVRPDARRFPRGARRALAHVPLVLTRTAQSVGPSGNHDAQSFHRAPRLRRRDLPAAHALRVSLRHANGWPEALAAIVHSIFPFLFVTTASRINDQLVELRAASRGRTVRLVDVETLQPLDYHI